LGVAVGFLAAVGEGDDDGDGDGDGDGDTSAEAGGSVGLGEGDGRGVRMPPVPRNTPHNSRPVNAATTAIT